jgi:hypothetical protein
MKFIILLSQKSKFTKAEHGRLECKALKGHKVPQVQRVQLEQPEQLAQKAIREIPALKVRKVM